MPRNERWRRNVEGANLRSLFRTGTADPHQGTTGRQGIPHMNQVFNNNRRLFPNVSSERNFYANFRRTAAEFLTEQAMNGARRRDNQRDSSGGGGNVGTFYCKFFIYFTNLTLFQILLPLLQTKHKKKNRKRTKKSRLLKELRSKRPTTIQLLTSKWILCSRGWK